MSDRTWAGCMVDDCRAKVTTVMGIRVVEYSADDPRDDLFADLFVCAKHEEILLGAGHHVVCEIEDYDDELDERESEDEEDS